MDLQVRDMPNKAQLWAIKGFWTEKFPFLYACTVLVLAEQSVLWNLHVILSFLNIFIRPKDVLWYPVSITIFIGMTWNFFCGHFRPPEIQIYQKKMFVILWLCDSVILWSVTYLTRFLYLNIIQSSPNFAQLFIWVVSRDGFLFFSNFQFLPPQGGL